MPRYTDEILDHWRELERVEIPAAGDRYWDNRLEAWVPVVGSNLEVLTIRWLMPGGAGMGIIRRKNGGPA